MGHQTIALGAHAAPLLFVILTVVGLATCFLGYGLFRLLLGAWGFLAGAALGAGALHGMNVEPLVQVLGALVAGIVGALAVSLLYLLGVFLFGAGFGVLVASVVLSHWPMTLEWPLILVLAVLGGVAALALQRPLITLATAFSGAWLAVTSVIGLLRGCAIEAWPHRCVPPSWSLAVVGVWLLLGLFGLAAQSRHSRRRPARDDDHE
jgi:hypothetical protein